MRLLGRPLAVIVLMAASSAASAEQDPRRWLDDMVNALSTRNYEGVFFHIGNGKVESMKIVHRVSNGKVSERLVSLDGAGREILRNEEEVTCILPDRRSVLVERRADDRPLVAALPVYQEGLDAHYDFVIKGRGRWLGRNTRIIEVQPRDGYRYGYRLWLDESTKMPLKSQLRDEHGSVIEQILFATISLPERISDDALQPDVSVEDYTWYRQGPESQPEASNDIWRAGQVPEGFELAAARTQMIAGGDTPVEHLVYSDGLATVSVFVELTADAGIEQGASRVGAANAFSTRIESHHVTAVGEVPVNTVELIARSVFRRALDARR